MNKDANYIVYLLTNTKHPTRSYLGVTNNSEKRIKQHNGLIVGGAKYTKAKKGKGIWKYHIKITNLTKNEAYSIEMKIKKSKWGKKYICKGKTNIDRKTNFLINYVKQKYSKANIIVFLSSNIESDSSLALA